MSELKLVPLGAGQGLTVQYGVEATAAEAGDTILTGDETDTRTEAVTEAVKNNVGAVKTEAASDTASVDEPHRSNTIETESSHDGSQDSQNDSSVLKTDPDPHNIRLQAMMKAFDTTVKKSLSGCKLSVFAKEYSQLYKRKPQAVKRISAYFLEQMHDTIVADVSKNLTEDTVPDKLLELQKLADEVPVGSKAWRPSGDVDLDMVAHTMPALVQHKSKLEETLAQLNKENELLVQSIRARKVQNEKNAELVRAAMEELDQKAAMLDSDR